MAADLNLKDAFTLFTHHLRAGGYEEHRVSLYEQTIQGPVKSLIATYLPAESSGRDIDELPISHIPHEIIQKCMSPTQNFTLRTARKFFKFLIHAGMLDPGFLPTRKTLLIEAIEQPPDEISAAMSLHHASRAFTRHLWEQKTL